MMASAAAGNDAHGPGGVKGDVVGGGAGALRQPELGLKCPRCDSPNTKFCYYNNYSLAQPRYFCKTCRRYWTKGGALRNVPVGGGCRKSKKSKSSSTAARLSFDGPAQELRLYQLGLSSVVDFHLGAGVGLPCSRLHHPFATGPGVNFNGEPATTDGTVSNHPTSFRELSCLATALPADTTGATPAPILGFSYPLQAVPFADLGVGGESTTPGTNLMTMNGHQLASSIESLSSVNQSLHWKLQQQRLAMFFGVDQSHHQHPDGQRDGDPPATAALLEGRPCQHMPCGATVVPDVSRKVSMASADDFRSGTTEWFLDNPATYTTGTPT